MEPPPSPSPSVYPKTLFVDWNRRGRLDPYMARPPRAPGLWALLVLLAACCPQAAAHSTTPSTTNATGARRAALADEARALGDAQHRPIAVGRSTLPTARAIANLSDRECRRILRNASVRFDPVTRSQGEGVASPLALRSAVLGVQFEPANGMATNGVVDCRLAVALLAWAPILRDAGVVRVEHFSTYRPGARVRNTGKQSGHAHALAIDAARFHLKDGRVLEVDADWDERERGGAPCPVRRDEDENGRVLRQLVCRAVERDLFQVVITPHHDQAHQNHVHLELVPEVDWSYVK